MAGIQLSSSLTGNYRGGTLPAGYGNGIVVGSAPAPKPAPPPPPPPPPPAPTYVPAPAASASGPSLTFGGNTFTNVYNTTQQAAPSLEPSPAMENLQAFGAGEGLREGLQREGWSGDPMAELDVPGGRSLPYSSRALATLATRQGRVY